jgi:hypothetical protein
MGGSIMKVATETRERDTRRGRRWWRTQNEYRTSTDYAKEMRLAPLPSQYLVVPAAE